jgi:hypothetical protein
MGVSNPPIGLLYSLQIDCEEVFMPAVLANEIPVFYEIRISGRLNPEWAEWFGNIDIRMEQTSEGASSILSGPVADQAALFGILNRIRDLGLRLISVNMIAPDKAHKTNREPGQEVEG